MPPNSFMQRLKSWLAKVIGIRSIEIPKPPAEQKSITQKPTVTQTRVEDLKPPKVNPAILEFFATDEIYHVAQSFVGIKEIPGPSHNPIIVAWHKAVGIVGRLLTDETPWCSSSWNAVVTTAGYKGTGSARARSWLRWGREIPLSKAHPGDTVVRQRGSDPTQGHVHGFVRMSSDPGFYYGIGGNQHNEFCVAKYPVEGILSVRRIKV